MQIIGDDLLRIVLECQETNVSEHGLECSRNNVRPVQHPIELGWIGHAAFECWQEDLRCVREHDDAERDGKAFHVDGPSNFRPAPLANLQQAVGENDEVDEEM